jgi:hypothetical protein
MELHSSISDDLLGLALTFCLNSSEITIVTTPKLCDQASHALNRPSSGQLAFFVLARMAQLTYAE